MTGDTCLIAVDGGGTGCRAAVGTVARGVLAEAQGGPGNVMSDFEGALTNILGAVERAVAASGLPAGAFEDAVAHLGLAGANSRADMIAVERALPFRRCTVTGDRATAVAGALGPGNGFLVALGTGTIVARQKDGAVATVGGWGFVLSDEASGAWLGRALLAHVLQAEDGIAAHSDLTRRALEAAGGREAIVAFAADGRPADYAEHARAVIEAAQAGDAVAVALMQGGADYIDRALAALGYAEDDVLCLSGGVGPSYAPFLPDRLTRNLAAPKGSALDGAFAMARRAAESAS
jgi:glucosamine kinase